NVCFPEGGDGGFFPIDAGDASTPPREACLNPADQAAGSDATKVSDAAQTCGAGCFGMPHKTCAAKCMTRLVGFSEACAACWGDSINCVTTNCLNECLGGAKDPVCIACSNQHCTPAFHACSGM